MSRNQNQLEYSVQKICQELKLKKSMATSQSRFVLASQELDRRRRRVERRLIALLNNREMNELSFLEIDHMSEEARIWMEEQEAFDHLVEKCNHYREEYRRGLRPIPPIMEINHFFPEPEQISKEQALANKRLRLIQIQNQNRFYSIIRHRMSVVEGRVIEDDHVLDMSPTLQRTSEIIYVESFHDYYYEIPIGQRTYGREDFVAQLQDMRIVYNSDLTGFFGNDFVEILKLIMTDQEYAYSFVFFYEHEFFAMTLISFETDQYYSGHLSGIGRIFHSGIDDEKFNQRILQIEFDFQRTYKTIAIKINEIGMDTSPEMYMQFKINPIQLRNNPFVMEISNLKDYPPYEILQGEIKRFMIFKSNDQSVLSP